MRDRFREPDASYGDWAMWWGPSKDYEEAESLVEVDGSVVSQYDSLAGYEGFGDDDWRVIAVDLDYSKGGTPRDVRARAAKGVDLILRYGGEERIVDRSELPRPE